MLKAKMSLTSFLFRIISTYENKVKVDAGDYPSRKFRGFLLHKYGKISFSNFVNLILYQGESKNCSTPACIMDNHVR